MDDISYGGVKKLKDVGRKFYFGKTLGYLNLPDQFIEDFDWYSENYHKLDRNADSFLARFSDYVQICLFTSTPSIDGLRTDNSIISESMYAEPGSIIMPPNHIAIGEAFNSTNRMRILINLEEGGNDYGKIYAWNLAYDPLGQGDNTRGIGYVADSFREFIENLQPEDKL